MGNLIIAANSMCHRLTPKEGPHFKPNASVKIPMYVGLLGRRRNGNLPAGSNFLILEKYSSARAVNELCLFYTISYQ